MILVAINCTCELSTSTLGGKSSNTALHPPGSNAADLTRAIIDRRLTYKSLI